MDRALADDAGKLVLRLALGILILLHGIAKLIYGIDPIKGIAEGQGLPVFFAYGAYLGEIVGPVLLILGWYARVGAGLIAINMLFAIGLAHRQDLFVLTETGGWSLELQGMFLFTAIALILMGPGRMAINPRY